MSRKQRERSYLECLVDFQRELAHPANFQNASKLLATLTNFLTKYQQAFPREDYRYFPSASNVMSLFKGRGRHQFHSHKRAHEAQALLTALEDGCNQQGRDELQLIQQVLAHYILYRLCLHKGKSKIVTGGLFAVAEALLVASADLKDDLGRSLSYDRALCRDKRNSKRAEALLSQAGLTTGYDAYITAIINVIDPGFQLSGQDWQVYFKRFMPEVRYAEKYRLADVSKAPSTLVQLLTMSADELKQSIKCLAKKSANGQGLAVRIK